MFEYINMNIWISHCKWHLCIVIVFILIVLNDYDKCFYIQQHICLAVNVKDLFTSINKFTSNQIHMTCSGGIFSLYNLNKMIAAYVLSQKCKQQHIWIIGKQTNGCWPLYRKIGDSTRDFGLCTPKLVRVQWIFTWKLLTAQWILAYLIDSIEKPQWVSIQVPESLFFDFFHFLFLSIFLFL